MSEDIKLKPCPFCGEPAYLQKRQEWGTAIYRIGCDSALCTVQPISREFTDEDEIAARIAWNRRALSEQPSVEMGLERAVEVLNEHRHGEFNWRLSGQPIFAVEQDAEWGCVQIRFTEFEVIAIARAYLRDSEPAWINVTERLPTDPKEYLITAGGGTSVAYWSDAKPADPDFPNWKELPAGWNTDEGLEIEGVVAWAEMPTPYVLAAPEAIS